MSEHVMRAKFVVNKVEEHFDSNKNKLGETLYMSPVCKSGAYPEDGHDEDNSFARWSPSGSLSLYVANPSLWGKLAVGAKFYSDFSTAN